MIDAVFAAASDGKVPPTVDDVAERAGVSASSVFRSFDGIDDLHRQAFEVFQQRYSHLFEPAVAPSARRSDRVAGHVKVRLHIFHEAGPMLRIARQRSIDHEPMAAAVAHGRSRLADQTRAHFGAEAEQLTPADAANLTATIDALTSPDAYEVMGAAHGRSHRQIGRAWVIAIEALLAGWPTLSDHPQGGHVVPGTA